MMTLMMLYKKFIEQLDPMAYVFSHSNLELLNLIQDTLM